MNETVNRAKPTERQLEWADMEVGVIIHYLMDIYNPQCKLYKTDAVRTEMPPSIFAPEGWDTDQWMCSAAEAGAKYAVLVANHCTGFSLWQTKVNDYSVASCAYKNGKGDIVREFIESCGKYGIRPGLYYSTGCNGYYNINDEWKWDYKSDEYQSYVKNVEAQIKELWSEYGELFEIWFDGGIVPVDSGGPDLVPLLKKYQPNALCFQGPEGYPNNLRWVGNENGLAPADCFSSYGGGTAMAGVEFDGAKAGSGSPFGKYWMPAETDMPNRDHGAFGGGWGWQPNETDHVFTPEHLLDCYLRSVGHNSNLLLGMAIAKNGRFEDEEQFIEFGKLIDKTFGKDAIVAQSGISDKLTQVISLPRKMKVDYVSIREDITEGHRILGFNLKGDGKEIASGYCIGHRRIIPVGQDMEKLELQITDFADNPVIRDITVYSNNT